MDTDRMQKSCGSVSGESSARDNIRHIWKCNQELLRYADDHLDAYVKRLSASGPPASSLDIAEKLGFRGKLRTRTVEVYRFALLETGRYPYTLTQGSDNVFVNGKPLVRLGDETTHCGGKGKTILGSPTVFCN